MKKLLFCLGTIALVTAQAASYKVTLFQKSTVNGRELEAGDYKVEVKDKAVVLKRDKETIETAAHTETAANKYPRTSVRYSGSNIKEICIGGTTTKIILDGSSNTAGGS